MSTQIFINPNSNACKPEYTKIAAHSFAFAPLNDDALLYGQYNFSNFSGQYLPTWSLDRYDFNIPNTAFSIKVDNFTVGIPIPINLVSDDIVTLTGTAFFINYADYIENGYDIKLAVGISYFNCNEVIQQSGALRYTFLPIEYFTPDATGQFCFSTNVTLGSNYDLHSTRLLVGWNLIITCPGGGCTPPAPDYSDAVTVSYTLDIERPCPVITSESNFIIKNCCEPIITELVNIPGLVVGEFHVDDEGNCWEVISSSTDVTNFTRNFIDVYTSCVECQAANPCPLNLKIQSCCVEGQEYVTGSLPGLNVGDTFLDNNGLCWLVSEETGIPLSEESITVDTIITGDCIDCTTANPCPSFWRVDSCCGRLSEIIATSVPLTVGNNFVDTNGICWNVKDTEQNLPTNYNIIVDTVYAGGDDCATCIAANPCPTEYFLTIRNCCDNDRIEVAQVPANEMAFYEGLVFRDWFGVCWEVMSYSTTGVETYPIWDWISEPFGISTFPDCFTCRNTGGKFVPCNIYEVQKCGETTTSLYYLGFLPQIGSVYTSPRLNACYEVIGYGYPTLIDPINILPVINVPYVDCTDCLNQ